MRSLDEWRELLGRPELTDEEVGEFVQDLRNFIGRVLDDYLRDAFGPDEL